MIGATVKYLIKEGLMLGLYGMGVLSPKRKTPVIIYHSIDASGSCVSLEPALFERQMNYLHKKGYRTVTLGSIVDLRQRGLAEPGRTVVLTFDDGILNNYDIVFPLLHERGMTATIFLATDFVGRKCTWDKKPDIPDLPLMNWEMAREMDRYGFEFQPHTATHPHLPRLTDREIRNEVRRSRADMEDRLGKQCSILCYPYGEFDGRVVRILQEEGFTGAAAIHPEREGPYSIRRVGSAQFGSHLDFKTAVAGTFPLYRGLRNKARALTGWFRISDRKRERGTG